MSSTNRGYDRHVSDYYVTPSKPIKDFLSEFLTVEKIDRPDRLRWLDPCAGGDEAHGMAYADVIEAEFSPYLTTMDIREDSRAAEKRDFLNNSPVGPNFDIVISNPPFLYAAEFIESAMQCVSEGGYVAFLLRLNFWGSKKREAIFNKHMPKYCFVHSRRISFTEDGKTDSIEYAHFVWQKGHHPEFTKTYHIEG